MDVLHPRCAGLDVHKDSVVAAVRLAEPGGVRSEARRFDATRGGGGPAARPPSPPPPRLDCWRWATGWPSAAAPMP